MVQVDVFWSYGIGAGFALAASRQLLRERPERREGGLLANPYFVRSLLFLAVLFVPSGVCLLWAFPSWETMHAGDRNLPAWLVTAFAVTNVTQGILGFWVTYRLTAAKRPYLAFLQPVLAYFLMFFILVHGWDGTGYRRFFSVSREAYMAWTSGNVAAWLGSDVALTLYAMGVFIVPTMLYWMSTWIVEGSARARSKLRVTLWILAMIFGAALGSAIAASVLVHRLGWSSGALAFALIAGVLVVGPRGLCRRLFARVMPEEATA